jgi:ubiquinone/menaquinone biosynthesis C-methylase UbiE
MSVPIDVQPDQQPDRWNNHVAVYEAVFESLTNAFAEDALDRLNLHGGATLIDIAAGCGGAALFAAARGCDVLAIDASPAMVSRIQSRSAAAAIDKNFPRGRVTAQCMDGSALDLPEGQFDAALSIFGIVLFPDAPQGIREAYRVLKPGGRLAIVTWTDTHRYELAARLSNAVSAICGPLPPPASLPAQLRFREEPAFRSLMSDAGFSIESVARVEKSWRLPSARWIAERIAFAPGMAAMIAGLGPDRAAVLKSFVSTLESDQGHGEIALSAVAFIGIAAKPA